MSFLQKRVVVEGESEIWVVPKELDGDNEKTFLLLNVIFFVVSNFLISAALDKAPHLRREKFNKRRGAYLSKYGIYFSPHVHLNSRTLRL